MSSTPVILSEPGAGNGTRNLEGSKLDPDVEDGDPTGGLVYSIRVAGDIANTPVKIEVGAIGVDDNATFWEEDGFCVKEVDDGCEEEE